MRGEAGLPAPQLGAPGPELERAGRHCIQLQRGVYYQGLSAKDPTRHTPDVRAQYLRHLTVTSTLRNDHDNDHAMIVTIMICEHMCGRWKCASTHKRARKVDDARAPQIGTAAF
jgi:hypothetical protein